MNEGGVERALAHVAEELRRRHHRFALVGGLGVSIRGEVRFTRDVDLAIHATSDDEVEALVRDLASAGYAPLTVVEQDAKSRLATVRLRAPSGIVVDLLAASSGIEEEVVDRATEVAIEGVGSNPRRTRRGAPRVEGALDDREAASRRHRRGEPDRDESLARSRRRARPSRANRSSRIPSWAGSGGEAGSLARGSNVTRARARLPSREGL